jgi:hypothetical protein
VCEQDCRLAVIGRDKGARALLPEPEVRFFLVRLVAGRLVESDERAPTAAG